MWNLVTTMNNIKLKYHNGKTTLRMRDDDDDDDDANEIQRNKYHKYLKRTASH